jgi:predicted RNA-binding Zn ribbon-like protein
VDGEKHGLSKAVQPGGRAEAPGDLALVQAFVNTHYDLRSADGGEMLASPRALGAWLRRQGLLDANAVVRRSELRAGLGVREALRALAFANNGIHPHRTAPAALADAAAIVEVRVSADGPTFVQARRDRVEGAIGVLLAITARAMLEGSWTRMKACPGRHCGWVFYDRSRNGTGRWCSMAVCGGREKARAYYERRTARGGR